MEAYQFNKSIKWVQKFLLEWEQRAVLGKNTSVWKKVMSGVPQGSVLGPTLPGVVYGESAPQTTQPQNFKTIRPQSM